MQLDLRIKCVLYQTRIMNLLSNRPLMKREKTIEKVRCFVCMKFRNTHFTCFFCLLVLNRCTSLHTQKDQKSILLATVHKTYLQTLNFILRDSNIFRLMSVFRIPPNSYHIPHILQSLHHYNFFNTNILEIPQQCRKILSSLPF